jgi:hypothetical protein
MVCTFRALIALALISLRDVSYVGGESKMEKRRASQMHAPRPARAGKLVWAGYVLCAWAIFFAAANVYLQLGLPDPLQHGEVHHFTGWVMALNLGVIPIKLLAALTALALVQPWGERLPRFLRGLLIAAGWAGCVILVGYPLLGASLTALVQSGLLAAPPTGFKVGGGFQIETWLYGAFFLLPGILFGIVTWSYQRRLRNGHQERAVNLPSEAPA